jgi:hypothetical protein
MNFQVDQCGLVAYCGAAVLLRHIYLEHGEQAIIRQYWCENN